MNVTDQLSEDHLVDDATVVEGDVAPTRAPLADRLREAGPIPGGMALLAGLAWIVAMVTIDAIAPNPDPDRVVSAFDGFMQLAFTATTLAALIGLSMRRRFGLTATIAGGAVFVIGSATCWADGHVGSWIAVQAVFGIAMAVMATGMLLRRSEV